MYTVETISQAQIDKLVAARAKYESIIERCHARLDDAGIVDDEFDNLYERICAALDGKMVSKRRR